MSVFWRVVPKAKGKVKRGTDFQFELHKSLLERLKVGAGTLGLQEGYVHL